MHEFERYKRGFTGDTNQSPALLPVADFNGQSIPTANGGRISISASDFQGFYRPVLGQIAQLLHQQTRAANSKTHLPFINVSMMYWRRDE